MSQFRLRFPEDQLTKWARKYRAAARQGDIERERDIETRASPQARERGFLDRNDFLLLCRWKTARSQSHCARNTEAAVEEVTRVAFGAQDERLKVAALLALHGVRWPTASVLLHFCDRRPYPILDFRALWSLGVAAPTEYNFAFWNDYCGYVRGLHARTGLTMREVDRALWQYSKERQRAS
jgi:hypothetical protein